MLDEQIKHAPWRVLIILLLMGLIWVALYLLLAAVFGQIRRWELVAVVANQHIFVYFFLVLAVMLAFSNAVLSFGSLFGQREAGHLLAMPVSPRHVVCVKWLEGMFLSSWSFVLLGVPLMCAVASVAPVKWYYYPLFVGHFVGFITIPATFGIFAAWVVAMWAPRRPAPTAIWCGCIVLLLAILWLSNLAPSGDRDTEQWLRAAFRQISSAKHPLLPSTWTAKGIVAAIEQRVGESLFYLGVVAGNAVFLGWLTINTLAATWPEAYSRARQGRFKPTIRRGWVTEGLSWVLFFYLPRRARLMLLKDLRGFTRDAMQWSQMVIMFGLLIIYVINLPRFPVDLHDPNMKGLISFLNLTTVSLILATFTSRFVYPLLSLESQQLWLLGLLPGRRRGVLGVKLIFALTITVGSAVCIMALAARVLEMPPVWTAAHFALALSVCCGLCGLAIGLGARFPVLGQRNPARIASGFGGTFNLIVSMLFVLIIMAGVGYVTFAELRLGHGMPETLSLSSEIIIVLLVLLGLVTMAVPMWVGGRHFARLEI